MSKGWSLTGLTFTKLNEQRSAFVTSEANPVQQAELAEAARLAEEDYFDAFVGMEAEMIVAGKARLQATLDASLARERDSASDLTSAA